MLVWARLTLPTTPCGAPFVEPTIGVLRRHRLSHLPVLYVGESIARAKMLSVCNSMHCTSACCGTGVLADRNEQARILAHADVVRRAMDPEQEQDESKWFDDEILVDHDFPSRQAVGTATTRRGCVFLNHQGRCVLQKATNLGVTDVPLKPFYCTAFPITIHQGTLSLDVDNVEGTRHCCQPASGGVVSAVDAFRAELDHVLGLEGVSELRELLGRPGSRTG